MAPKQLHLVRHAQGYHNLSIENHNLRDPLLTPEGEQQCVKLSNEIKDIQSIDCIVASPIRRALYTALLTFQAVLKAKPDLRIIALPELQETSSLPCDIGSSLDELLLEFEGKPVDLSHLHQDWNNKDSGPYAPRVDLIKSRCRKARRFLQHRHENNVAVVTHGCLLHFLTGDWQEAMSGCGTGWSNCELRSYHFDTSMNETIANATIIETDDSRRVRDPHPLTTDEQIELQAITEQSWAADGYIVLADNTGVKEALSDDKDYRGSTDSDINVSALSVRPGDCSAQECNISSAKI